MTEVLEKPQEQTATGPSRFAHYVKKNGRVDAAVFGVPLEALCGHVFIPGQDEKGLAVCPPCKEIYEGNDLESVRRQAKVLGLSE